MDQKIIRAKRMNGRGHTMFGILEIELNKLPLVVYESDGYAGNLSATCSILKDNKAINNGIDSFDVEFDINEMVEQFVNRSDLLKKGVKDCIILFRVLGTAGLMKGKYTVIYTSMAFMHECSNIPMIISMQVPIPGFNYEHAYGKWYYVNESGYTVNDVDLVRLIDSGVILDYRDDVKEHMATVSVGNGEIKDRESFAFKYYQISDSFREFLGSIIDKKLCVLKKKQNDISSRSRRANGRNIIR